MTDTTLAPAQVRASPDERLKNPGLLIRLLGWLVRPVVWEAVRQHPQIDDMRLVGEPKLGLSDAITGQNRHQGFGP